MKRKGFTLIELLAVIVVLAVIALITVPTVLGVIEKSRKSSYKASMYGIINAADIYLTENLGKVSNNEEIVFTCDGVKCSNSEGDKLSFKGEVPKSGSIYIKGNGTVTVESVYNGRYYANTVDDDIEITEEDTSLTRAELTQLVKSLQQKVNQLEQQVQQSNQNTSSITNLKNQHESDVTSIQNILTSHTNSINSLNNQISNSTINTVRIETENGLGAIYYQKIGNIVYVTLQPNLLLYNINAWTTISKSALPIPPSKISMKLISIESGAEYYIQLDTDGYIKNGGQTIPAGVYYSASFSYWTY